MKFSIIIPTYNSEKEIEKALKSIYNQTYKDYEIIVIDDNSKDNTYNILKDIENITLIRNEESLKAGGARNKGLDIAKGDYIIFLDADDYFAEETTLEKINEVIGESDTDIVYLGFKRISKTDEEDWIPTEENSTLNRRAKDWIYENIWDVCWKRSFLNENNMRFVEKRYFEDFVFYYKGIIRAKKYKVASFITHIYTQYKNDSITSEVNTEKLRDLYYNIDKFLKLLDEVDEKDKPDIIYAIYRVVEYSTRLLLQYEKETRIKQEKIG